MDGMIDLSIVVPAYNEAARLEEGLGRLNAAFAGGSIDPITTEVVFVDDGSDDDTSKCAHELLAHLPHVRILRNERNCGKGAAIRVGVSAARGEVIAFGDADMAIDPDQFPLLVRALAQADVAIGSRTLPGAHATGGSAHRRAMGRVFNRLVNMLTGIGIGDTQCGFKGFRAAAGRLLFHCLVIDGFAFDADLLLSARRLGLRVAEVPVSWRNVAGTRVRPLADSMAMAADIVGSWARRRPPNAVTALSISSRGAGDASALRVAVEAAGRSMPVLEEPTGDAIILMPMAGREELMNVVRRLKAAGLRETSTIRAISLSFENLRARAPLRLTERSRAAALR